MQDFLHKIYVLSSQQPTMPKIVDYILQDEDA
jgi:hypothetical protein